MKNKIFLLVLGFISLISCTKQKKVDTGKLKFTYLMVKNASQEESEDYVELDISTVYFNKDNFIEVLPEYVENKKYNIIKGNYFVNADELKIQKWKENKDIVDNKKGGIAFFKVPLEGELHVINDTLLNGYNYARFTISTEDFYSVYYVHKTDTILPYSLNREIEKRGGGILNRIDTYIKKEDTFTSLRMTLSDTIQKKEYTFLKQMRDEL